MERNVIENDVVSKWPELFNKGVFKQQAATCAETAALALCYLKRKNINDQRSFYIELKEIEKFRRGRIGGVSAQEFESICAMLNIKLTRLTIDHWLHGNHHFPMIYRLAWSNLFSYLKNGDPDFNQDDNVRINDLNDESHVVLVMATNDDAFFVWDPNFSFVKPFSWWSKNNLVNRIKTPTQTCWNEFVYIIDEAGQVI